MSGHGIINWSDGRSFEGEFFDTLAGEGTFKLPNGHIVRGEMDNGEILGAVELELGNGVIYKGELDEWEPKSTGELVYPNGSVFNGEIDLDLMGGIGELTL